MSQANNANDEQASHVIVRQRLSLQETLAERMPMIVSFTIIGCFMLITGALLPLFMLSSHGSWLALIWWVAATAVVAVSLSAVARYCGSLCAADLKQIEKLEAGLASSQTKEPVQDLQRLVDLHHKHRHFGEAEFYSRRLLHALADAAQGKLVPTLASADCWLTTPAYKRSVAGKFLWLFETRGRLLLTQETLWFWSPKVSLCVNLSDVTGVERCKYTWWQKPVPTYYVLIRFIAEGQEHEVELTAGPQTGNAFDINSATNSLYEKLSGAIVKQRRLASK